MCFAQQFKYYASKLLKPALLAIVFLLADSCSPSDSKKEDSNVLPYLNTDLSLEERVNDLVGRMTLEEKISQMVNQAAAIERLDVPEYNWWSEGLHGVARAGLATVFPQAIGLGATWDRDLMFRVSNAISDEARAKHHDFAKKGNGTTGDAKGLVYRAFLFVSQRFGGIAVPHLTAEA